MERATGEVVPDLHPEPLRPCCKALWDTFIELHNARGGGMGPAPISWRDLRDWQEIRGVSLTPWEVDTLMAMDLEAMKVLNEKKKAQS